MNGNSAGDGCGHPAALAVAPRLSPWTARTSTLTTMFTTMVAASVRPCGSIYPIFEQENSIYRNTVMVYMPKAGSYGTLGFRSGRAFLTRIKSALASMQIYGLLYVAYYIFIGIGTGKDLSLLNDTI